MHLLIDCTHLCACTRHVDQPNNPPVLQISFDVWMGESKSFKPISVAKATTHGRMPIVPICFYISHSTCCQVLSHHLQLCLIFVTFESTVSIFNLPYRLMACLHVRLPLQQFWFCAYNPIPRASHVFHYCT